MSIMKIYEFGSWDAQVLLLLPGKCIGTKRSIG